MLKSNLLYLRCLNYALRIKPSQVCNLIVSVVFVAGISTVHFDLAD